MLTKHEKNHFLSKIPEKLTNFHSSNVVVLAY